MLIMRPSRPFHPHFPSHHSMPRWKKTEFHSVRKDIQLPQYEIPSYYNPPSSTTTTTTIQPSMVTMTNPNVSSTISSSPSHHHLSSHHPSSTSLLVSSNEPTTTSILANEDHPISISSSSSIDNNNDSRSKNTRNRPSLSPGRSSSQHQRHQHGFGKKRKNSNSSRQHSDRLSYYTRQVQMSLSMDSPESLEKYLQERRNRYPCSSSSTTATTTTSTTTATATATLLQLSNDRQEIPKEDQQGVSSSIESGNGLITIAEEISPNNTMTDHCCRSEEISLDLPSGNHPASDMKPYGDKSVRRIDSQSRNSKSRPSSLLFSRPSLYRQVSVIVEIMEI
jgi:hypothetical protein